MDMQRQERRSRGAARIGKLLVEMGSITEDQLAQALEEQERRQQLGVLSTIGEICVEEEWCQMRDIAIATREQEEKIFRASSLGQLLVDLSFVRPEQLDWALEVHTDFSAPIGETLLELGLCTEDQIRMAAEFQTLQRHGTIRRSTVSRYHPFNLMELVVNYEIDDIIAEREGCFCAECRANVFALAMNALLPRYVTDARLLLTYIERCRAECSELIRHRLEEAVDKVKKQPKGSCRGNLHHLNLERLTSIGSGFVNQVTVRVTNRHVHLSAAHQEALFGEGYELTRWKDLAQLGHYTTKEVVTLVGAKGSIDKVRVFGPLRRETQMEISGTDQYILGLRAPVRDSGHLEGTPGIRLVGPAGEIAVDRGVIRPLRHIHMTVENALKIGIKNGDLVDVRLNGDRTTICQGVLIRADEKAALEMHIDPDEANAAGVPSESIGEILGPSFQLSPL